MPAARRAGSQQAAAAIARKITTIPTKVIGSVGFTFTSMLVITRVVAMAITRPIPIPIALSQFNGVRIPGGARTQPPADDDADKQN